MYEDKRGYLRYKSNRRLVHRNVAYKEIYLPNKNRYKYRFSKYVVDHRDMNKKNNRASNLSLMPSDDHTDSHTGHDVPPWRKVVYFYAVLILLFWVINKNDILGGFLFLLIILGFILFLLWKLFSGVRSDLRYFIGGRKK